MSKKHKRIEVGDIVLLRGEVRMVLEVYPRYGNLGHVRLNGKPGERVVPIYSETYLSPIGRKGNGK